MFLFQSTFLTLSLCFASSTLVQAFAPSNVSGCRFITHLADATTTTAQDVTIDPKEAVKVFGRLAEKYIMLDASGGMCCYSACSGTMKMTKKYFNKEILNVTSIILLFFFSHFFCLFIIILY